MKQSSSRAIADLVFGLCFGWTAIASGAIVLGIVLSYNIGYKTPLANGINELWLSISCISLGVLLTIVAYILKYKLNRPIYTYSFLFLLSFLTNVPFWEISIRFLRFVPQDSRWTFLGFVVILTLISLYTNFSESFRVIVQSLPDRSSKQFDHNSATWYLIGHQPYHLLVFGEEKLTWLEILGRILLPLGGGVGALSSRFSPVSQYIFFSAILLFMGYGLASFVAKSLSGLIAFRLLEKRFGRSIVIATAKKVNSQQP